MSDDRRGIAPGAILLVVLATLLLVTSQSQNDIKRCAVGRLATANDAWATLDVPPGGLRPIFDSLQKVTFGGVLDDLDYAIIRRRIAEAACVTEGDVAAIEVFSEAKIEVRAGESEFGGVKHTIDLERRGDDWVVISNDRVGVWQSR
jgi:hypothetical protein